ncbi:MAG: hypothetical protein ACI841_005045 [Planctomycetota bacterium]|jgi:hypothetical protein
MKLAIASTALLMGALTVQAQAQTFTKPAVNPNVSAPTQIGGFFGGSDDCGTADIIAGSGNFSYDNTTATTGIEGQNESICYDFGTSGIATDVWFCWTAPNSGPATLTMCNGGGGDSKIASYAGAACPVDGTSLACNDDTCGLLSEIVFPVTGGSDYMLQIGCFPGGGQSSGSFDITVAAPPTLGTNYCVAGMNSVNAAGSNMSAAGSASIGAQNLTLSADNAPNQPAIFYYGPNQIALGFGNGTRCVGGTVVRLPVVNGSGGSFDYTVDFGLPQVNLMPGTVNFQCWYRDPAGGGAFFNMSDGYSIIMTP